MKHAKPSPNKKRIAAAALAVGTTGSIPLVLAGPANAVPSTAPQVAPAGGDVPTVCEDYIVNRGDNLSTIAARYGVSLTTLEALNPGIIAGDRPDDYSLIFRGGHVHLPDGNCTPVKTVPVPPRHTHERPVRVWYRDCTDAPAGLHRGQPGYRHALDMDGDGKACEGPWPPVTTPPVITPPVTTPPDDGGTTTPPVVTPPSGGLITPVIAPDCPGTNSGYCAHPVAFWAPLIQQAQQLVGGNVANASVSDIEGLMLSESSGDPNAINDYDINAQNGTPSKGLMQVIQPTFDAYHVAGTSLNLYDPLANIAAALAYINDLYGGNIPGSPY